MQRGYFTGILFTCVLDATLAGQVPTKVDFGRDVLPIFREHCAECHGPSQQMRGLRMDQRRSVMPNRVGANGASIVPGNSAVSKVYRRLSGNQAGLQMPPTGPLSAEQVNLVKLWIDQGAVWPDELAGEASRPPLDPQAARMMEALRNGDLQAFQKILRTDAKAVNGYGPNGSTPLMYAALYGDAGAVKLLLDRGADPNLPNDAHATALMYAVDDAEITRLLLEKGASANARSDDGLTAVLIAASRAGSSPVVKLLLEHGATLSAPAAVGPDAFSRAVAAGDETLVRMLIDHDAEKKAAPLGSALRAGCLACFEMLLKFASPNDLNATLATAAPMGDAPIVGRLLELGAKPDNRVLTSVALFTEAVPVSLARTLIEHGADVNAKTSTGGTILDLAKEQGDTPLVTLLIKSGAKAGPGTDHEVLKPKPAASVRAAIARSLPLVQRADAAFIQKAGCVSCHNNSLEAMAIAAARKSGISGDERLARTQLEGTAAYLAVNRERALQGLGFPGGSDTAGYILLGMSAEKYPADETTDVWARYLKNTQLPDGHWFVRGQRPPLEASNIQSTATAMRAMQFYGPKSKRPEYEQAVQRAVGWLEKAQPKNTEDRVFQLLGLTWGGGNRAMMQKAAAELLAEQRPDGGWAQLGSLSSDAYATGQALAALKEAGTLAVTASAYQRGVQFLVNSQLEDGSWYVQTRTLPNQPYFDSDFPHGRDQFISAAATNWAIMALAPAAR